MLKRFRDPQLRPRIVKEAEEAMNARFNGAEGVYLPATRRQLVDIMREMDVSAGEAVLDIVEQENTSAILRFGSEPDLIAVLQYPGDGHRVRLRGIDRHAHAPALLRHVSARARSLRSRDARAHVGGCRPEDDRASREHVGMVDRGLLAPGMAADVTVFDPAAVIDHATYDDPARPSVGIRYVIVNGHVALRDGKATGDARRTRADSNRPTCRAVALDLAAVTSCHVQRHGGQGAARRSICRSPRRLDTRPGRCASTTR